jgi:glutamyl-tRNA reductase
MHLLLVGLSHRTAPIELRERIDFQARGVASALDALATRGATREAVVLSTCNRVELYGVCEDLESARATVLRFISEFHAVDPRDVEPHLYSATDTAVTSHLFRVAAGLDSMVVGEPQILGQVKEAHSAASLARSSGPLLNRLFHSSFGVGKRVRTETGLGAGAVSIGFAAVALARKIFGDLKGRNVVVIGAGEMGKLTARYLKSQGVQQVTIVSRTVAHATRTAEAIGGATAAPWEEMMTLLGAADIVLTATGGTTAILTRSQIETVMRPRRNRPLFVIDIAMPRDVEATAGEIEQVFLYNIDDLQATIRENLARRASEVNRAEAIVGEEVEKFTSWLRSRGAIPLVVALRQRFEAVRQSELDRLTLGWSADTRQRVDDVTRLIMEKLLSMPTEQLKALGDADSVSAYGEALTRLFGLGQVQGTADPTAGSVDEAHRGDRGDRRVELFVRPSTGAGRPERVGGRPLKR